MTRKFLLFLLAVSAVFLVAAAPGDPAAKKDLQAMQGLWKVVELTEKGEKLGAKELAPVQALIVADKMTLMDDGKAREEITLRLDPSKKIKAVDFVYSKGPNIGKVERGIYSLEDDTLKFCVNETKDGARPTKFASTKANNSSLAVLQRIKK